jgi:hypothetical protein
LVQLRDRRRTLSFGLLAREGWHSRERKSCGRTRVHQSDRLSERGANSRAGQISWGARLGSQLVKLWNIEFREFKSEL